MSSVAVEIISLKRGEFGFDPVTVTSVDDVTKYLQENQPYKKSSGPHVFDKNYIYINLIEMCIEYDEGVIIPGAQKNKQESVWYKDKYVSTYDQQPIIFMNSEQVGFYVMEKLQYAKDIKDYLYNNHKNSVIFFQTDETLPIAFNGYTKKQERLFGKPEPTIILDATFNLVHTTNVVVDKNLKQIWPLDENLGKIPPAIIALLKQNRQKIRRA